MIADLPLRVFLSSVPKDRESLSRVHGLHLNETWIDSWDDNFEGIDSSRIPDVILVCLSKNSITEEGLLQSEIGYVMDIVDEHSEGAILVLVVRLEDCRIPGRLRRWQFIDYFNDGALRRLVGILREYFENQERIRPTILSSLEENNPDLYRFIRVEFNRKSSIPYVFWIGKYPVTNAQYERFISANDFGNEVYWQDFVKFDGHCKYIGNWGNNGLEFLLSEQQKRSKLKDDRVLKPLFWQDLNFGATKRNHPVVGISWFEANAYAKWLSFHWNEYNESHVNADLHLQILRLPLETEWHFAAQGDTKRRYPWSSHERKFGEGAFNTFMREIVARANVKETHNWCTTPVDAYPKGASIFGVMDMFGNVWEWLANENYDPEDPRPYAMAAWGGSWKYPFSSSSFGNNLAPPVTAATSDIGFRLVALPVIE